MSRVLKLFAFLIFLTVGWQCAFEPSSLPTGDIGESESPTWVERPLVCGHLLRDRNEDEWDQEREEYWPPNRAWEGCMGVERR